jgi:hypothetical protein
MFQLCNWKALDPADGFAVPDHLQETVHLGTAVVDMYNVIVHSAPYMEGSTASCGADIALTVAEYS